MSYKKSLLLLWIFIETRNWTVINWLIAGGREANWVVMGGRFCWLIYRRKWLRDNGRDLQNFYWNLSEFLKSFLIHGILSINPPKIVFIILIPKRTQKIIAINQAKPNHKMWANLDVNHQRLMESWRYDAICSSFIEKSWHRNPYYDKKITRVSCWQNTCDKYVT